MTTIPKIALAKIAGVESHVTPALDYGFHVIDTTEWYAAQQVEILHWIACIDPENADTLAHLSGSGSRSEMRSRLREIANPTPPLPEEPPIRSFLKDKTGAEWVMGTNGRMIGLSGLGVPIGCVLPWAEWYKQFGPGEVIES
jgi:hypothetical protein